MAYEEKGKIILFGKKESGQGKNGDTWEKVTFVIETLDSKYPKQIAFTVRDKQFDDFKGKKVGDIVKVSFSAESREHNGKYYTDLKAFKIEATTAEAPAPKSQPQRKNYAPANPQRETEHHDYGYDDESSDPLPF